MSLVRLEDRQSDLFLTWSELPRSAGHPFYDKLQDILRTAGFDEELCKPYYSSSKRGRKSLPPRRYFRMLLVGYFEGLASKRGFALTGQASGHEIERWQSWWKQQPRR